MEIQVRSNLSLNGIKFTRKFPNLSGGGVIAKNNDKWYLRGIVSYNPIDNDTKLCIASYPSVFTDVARHTTWIQDHINTYG